MRHLVQAVLLSAVALFGAPADATKAQTFATAQEALDALVKAADGGMDALRAIFGPGSADILRSGDDVQDKALLSQFNRRAHEKAALDPDPLNPDHVEILLGEDEFPFAIPLVKQNGRWHFDLQQGKEEVRRRVIGSNELDAIEVCHGYVEAQYQYAEEDRDGDGVIEYAQRIISSPGKKDGLYWPGEDSPVAEAFAKAVAEGYGAGANKGKREYRGYTYKVLQSQGPNAEMGSQDYVVQGHMIGGFALVGWPAEYGVSGIKTFIVNQDGVIYEKDLGPQTDALARAMTKFNPDKSWRVAE